MKQLNKYIDHTNLKPFATRRDIEKLCDEARKYDFASVCVNPCNVSLCKELLDGTTVKVCTVIGFPLGQNTTETKIAETLVANAEGCEEFDMVINIGALKQGDYEFVRDEIASVVTAADGKTVKVIIETGLLTDEEKVMATKLSCEAGAHFVKTCTGFSQGSATVEDIALMKQNVTEGVCVKASGGIKTLASALALIEAGADRLGTSSGADIIAEYQK